LDAPQKASEDGFINRFSGCMFFFLFVCGDGRRPNTSVRWNHTAPGALFGMSVPEILTIVNK